MEPSAAWDGISPMLLFWRSPGFVPILLETGPACLSAQPEEDRHA